jgi:hypothetical protein
MKITDHYWNQQATRLALQLRYNLIVQLAIGLAAFGLVVIYAFTFTFTMFGSFDDDGYFLQAYRDFLSGRPAYDQVFSFYGPFTFYSGALTARFNASNVTHDSFRWALLPVWIVIALLMAGIILRWTGRFSPAVIAFLLIGFRLLGLAASVGHPQVWILLAVALVLWLGIEWVYLPSQRWRAFYTGLLIALILLCKINVGVFVGVAIALTGSLLLRGRLRMLTSGVFVAAAIGLDLALFLTSPTASEKYFALVCILSLAAIVAIAIGRTAEQKPSVKNLLWLMAALGMCVVIGVGVIVFYGTTMRALFNSLIVYPALFARSYHKPFVSATKKASIMISIAGLSTAFAALYCCHLGERARVWLGLLKVVAGAGLLYSFIRLPGQALTGSFIFLLLLLVDDPPMSQSRFANRLLLVLLCLLFSLQLFPMAGTQLSWAELLPIAAAAMLIGDGSNCVERNFYRGKSPRFARAAAIWTGPLLAILLFVPFGKATLSRYLQWRGAQSLGLPGAYGLRLTPLEAARLTGPVKELRRHCRVILTIPGMYSYSIWSGVPPIEERRINTWPFLWPEEALRKDLPKLREQDGGCVLVNETEYRFFKNIAVSPGYDEVLSEVQRTMNPIYKFQDIILYRAGGTILHSDIDVQAPKAKP